MGKPEEKGMILNTTVASQLKNEQSIDYKTRIYEGIPKFSYIPRGREIFQRLIIRAALCTSLDELVTQREIDEQKKKEEEKIKAREEEMETEKKRQEERLREIYELERTEGVD